MFIVLSLIIGKITSLTFIFYFQDSNIRNISLVIYLLSWPMLGIGAWWAGKECVECVNKYFDYKFYHQESKKAYHLTKKKSKELHARTKDKAKKFLRK